MNLAESSLKYELMLALCREVEGLHSWEKELLARTEIEHEANTVFYSGVGKKPSKALAYRGILKAFLLGLSLGRELSLPGANTAEIRERGFRLLTTLRFSWTTPFIIGLRIAEEVADVAPFIGSEKPDVLAGLPRECKGWDILGRLNRVWDRHQELFEPLPEGAGEEKGGQ